MAALSPGLAALCAQLGVDATYTGWDGRPVVAPEAAVVAVLRALGVELGDGADAGALAEAHAAAAWREPLPPVLVAWLDGDAGHLDVPVSWPAAADGELTLTLVHEDGAETTSTCRLFELPADGHATAAGVEHCVRHAARVVTAAGYHRLRWRLGDAEGEVAAIAAPRRAYATGARRWGTFAPTYALRSARSGGAGDLRDLARLAEVTRAAGGGFVGTLPLLAAFLDEPCEASPYAAASRLAWNELYLDLGRLAAEVGATAAEALLASAPLVAERARLAAEPLIDYRAQYAWRRRVLDVIADAAWASPVVRPALEAFARTPHALRYAVFRAVGEARRQPWSAWPEALRVAVRAVDAPAPGAPLDVDVVVAGLAHDGPARVRTHLLAQWAMEGQLGALPTATGCGLYVDLPVGVGSDAYDVFVHPELFVTEAATGAPPDALFLGGQDWGLPPLHPARARVGGWRYLADVVRHHMRHAALLRIDHVMGLHRLFWVPRGQPASAGVYVRYAADELWAILCLESHRQQCELVGEDLGVVPPEVPVAMAAHGARGLTVRQFSLPGRVGQAPAVPPAATVASLGTHDTPTFAAHWRGDDVDILRELGLVDEAQAASARAARVRSRGAVLAELAGQGYVDAGLPATAPGAEAAALRGLHRQLAASPAQDVLITVEDLWLEPRPQNVPGTSHERPNWRRPHARTIDAWAADPEIVAQLAEIDAARRR